MAAFSGITFELQKGRKVSALHVDLPHPLCAAISPDGAGAAALDAVAEVGCMLAEGDVLKEEKGAREEEEEVEAE